MIDLVNEQEALPPPEAHIRIKVTNRNSRVIRDRHDGVPFTFKPNDQVTVTQAQANHFFGWPGDLEQRTHYMAKRFGWNTQEYVLRGYAMVDGKLVPDPTAGPDAKSILEMLVDNIILEVEEMVLVSKKQVLADDMLDVDSMPTMGDEDFGPEPSSRASGPGMGTKVGVRKGSPVRLGGNRKPGRPRKPEPPIEPPLG
jgi:hypothetical protein